MLTLDATGGLTFGEVSLEPRNWGPLEAERFSQELIVHAYHRLRGEGQGGPWGPNPLA